MNRIVVGAHYGLKDWIAQRATAVLMALYTVLMAGVILVVQPSDFAGWHFYILLGKRCTYVRGCNAVSCHLLWA